MKQKLARRVETDGLDEAIRRIPLAKPDGELTFKRYGQTTEPVDEATRLRAITRIIAKKNGIKETEIKKAGKISAREHARGVIYLLEEARKIEEKLYGNSFASDKLGDKLRKVRTDLVTGFEHELMAEKRFESACDQLDKEHVGTVIELLELFKILELEEKRNK